MVGREDFYRMDKRDAYNYIWDCIAYFLRTYPNETGRIRENVEQIIYNWNTNNIFGDNIDCYEYATDFRDGEVVGLGIEDEYFIYPEFQDEWYEYQENMIK